VAGAAVVRPDLQVVEHVVIEGHQQAGAGALRHLADLENGTQVWSVDTAAIARGVKRHPWVREARAELEWPATVRITVEEHRPVALLAGPRMLYVSADGLAFAPASTDDLDHPVISLGDEALHPEVPARVVRAALELVATLDERGVVPRHRIGEVAFRATHGFTVHVTGGAELRFAHDGFDRQAGRLARLLEEGVRLDEPLLIDLAPAEIAIVRPREVAHVEG